MPGAHKSCKSGCKEAADLLRFVPRRLLMRCRYGYKSVDEVQEVVANYSASGIPLDTMWGDIDYMHQWRDFTLDPANYPRDRMQVLPCIIDPVQLPHPEMPGGLATF